VLSFVYALLLRDVVIALHSAGLDPYIGLLHRPRFGRPSLALDLMEELRPLVGDSTVMLVVNNGELRRSDLVRRAGAVALTAPGRRRVIEA
jgi:CRISP-associated protein Cas1